MKRNSSSGFTLIEALVVVAIASVLAGIAIPMILNAMKSYRLTAAVAAATGAIQSTRYQAIMRGYQYQIVITPATLSYRVYKMLPPATTFSADGAAIPIARSGDVTIDQTATIIFKQDGTVSGTPSNMTFNITNGIVTKQIQVSGVGNVSVTP